MNKLKNSNNNLIFNSDVYIYINIVQGSEGNPNSETSKSVSSGKEISLNIYTDDLNSKNPNWINDLSKGSSNSQMLEFIFTKVKQNLTQIKMEEESGLKDIVSDAVDHAFATYLLEHKEKGSLIMADSIASSFEYKKDIDYLNSIKDVIPKAQNKYFVFLSAITKKKNNNKENTIEYKVALQLKEYFEKKDIGVFWWEDPSIKSHNWNISTKIAMGLGFSTVFVGLAFDSISKDKEKGNYIYNCLFDDKNAYKTPNFFKYEVSKFSLLFNKKESKKFFKGIINTKSDFSKFVPKQRFMRFFTFESPKDFTPYPDFNGKEDRWISIDEPLGSFSEEEKIQAIFNKIVQNLENLPFQNFKNNKYDDLYKPFDITKMNDQPYTDDFLKDQTSPSLNENYQMIPSDYFFEYLIIDKNGKNAKNHFLIFPEKEYTKTGNISWNIKLIVKDWNYKEIFNKSSLLSDYEKIGITKSFDSEFDGETYPTWTRKAYDDSKSCAYDLCTDVFTNNEGKMQGKILLMKRDGEKIEFYYSINFIPKQIIRYRTKNRRIKLLDKTNLPLKIKIAFPKSTDNGIGCLTNSGLRDDEYILKNNLKVSGLKKGCRLRLQKTTKNKYIILKSMDSQALDMIKPLKSSPQRCILCGNIVSKKIKTSCMGVSKQKENPKCKHNYIYDVFDFEDNDSAQRQFKIKDIEVQKDNKTYIYKCETDQLPPSPTKNSEMALPENFRNGVVISFVGESKTGKSTFISSLFGVSNNMVHDNIINNSLQPYVSKTSFYCDNVPTNYKENMSRYILEHDYTALKYGDFIKPTSNVGETEPFARSHIPFILRLEGIQNSDEEAYLSFFDAPGGTMYKKLKNNDKPYDTPFSEKNNDYVMLFKSDSIILIVNGTPKPNEEQQNELNVDGVTQILRSIDAYKEKTKEFYEKTILAVVLCKFDEFAKDFDENSYTRMTAPTAYARIFKNSERHKYIEMCSKEIKSYLNSFNQTSGLLNEIDKYKHHCFFATSSIGRTDSVIRKIDIDSDSKKDTTQSIFFTTPYNIENILLWIMYQKGIIL
ncbi:MAG: hypothetical protein NC087_01105 [Anaeroplasma bactoclasticum]|nr:hypothetical protein [Anaeroplasma bactoclasticum]